MVTSILAINILHNEEQLVTEMQNGSEEAFAMLYRHYSPQLYYNILGMIKDPLLAEEIIQELFTRIWNKKSNIGLKENFSGYIYRTGQHLVHDFFRRLQRERELLERFRVFAEANYVHIEEALNHRDAAAILQKALDELPPQQRKVYDLVKIHGHTYREAAGILNISPLTVKEYIVAANKSIRSYILTNTDTALGLLLMFAFQKNFS